MADLKLPPHNIDAEEAVLGSLLIDSEMMTQVSGLEPSHFLYDTNQWIYEAMIAVSKSGASINQITVAQKLSATGKLEACGGAAQLSHLISICPTSIDCPHYAAIVRNMAIHRELIKVAEKIATIGYDEKGEPSEIIAKADQLLLTLRKSHGTIDVISPRDRASMLIERYTELNNAENKVATPTGFLDLDKQLGGGFFAGELIVLAGDSGLGKSTLAHNMAIHQSNYGNVLFCSGEMTVEALSDKEVASILKRSVLEIRAGQYDDDLFNKIMSEAIGMISERPLFLYRGLPLTVAGIKQAAYETQTRHGGITSIVVDYLQKIQWPASKEPIYRLLGEVTTQLADLAKELSVPIILCAQLGSDIDKRENKRPHKGDIYESKRIEQDADVILLLYRVDKYFTEGEWALEYNTRASAKGWKGIYGEDFPEGIAEIIIEKQRLGAGKRKIVKVCWDNASQSYRNMAKQESML